MKDLHPTFSSMSKVLGLIGAIVTGVVFVASNVVLAGEYHDDQLAMRSTLLAIQVNLIGVQIDRAEDNYDIDKVKELEHTRDRLEREQEIVMEKQLDN